MRARVAVLALAVAGLGARCRAQCAASNTAGARCEAGILRLRPTQFDLGMIEVRERAERMRGMSQDQLKEYLDDKPAPIVVGPGGAFFIVDRHHLARALAEIGQESMPAVIEANWRDVPEAEFWRRMERRRWVWLYDRGDGPLGPERLPKTVLGMKDDPYRSLARAVREKGGYKKTAVAFAEFQWAGFFRSRIPARTVEENFNAAVENALNLAHDPAAKDLPGHTPAGR